MTPRERARRAKQMILGFIDEALAGEIDYDDDDDLVALWKERNRVARFLGLGEIE